MQKPDNALLVTVTGSDRPGIAARLLGVLAGHRIPLIDIRQASLHNRFGLSLVLGMSSPGEPSDHVVKDLLLEASRLDLAMDFQLIPEGRVEKEARPGVYAITHFGDTEALAGLSVVLAEEGANIEGITTAFHHGARSMEMIVDLGAVDRVGRVKERLMARSRELEVDLGIQTMAAYRKNKRLVFFDVDSTLVDMEIIDEMAREAGVYREVSRITERAMRGEFDFEESLVQRVALLKGLTLEQLTGIRDRMRLSDGVEELITTLKWLGFKLGLVSGGFDFFTDHLRDRLGFDIAVANRLDIRGGRLSGKVKGDLVDASMKARIVNRTACDLKVLLDQTVVVGDGANDALMLGQAGLGIAYNAKKALDRVANAALGKRHMTNILHLLGIAEEDVSEACACRAEPFSSG